MNGGDDGTRTRGLCRDSAPSFSNCLKLRGTDGYQNRALEPPVTINWTMNGPRNGLCRRTAETEIKNDQSRPHPLSAGDFFPSSPAVYMPRISNPIVVTEPIHIVNTAA